MIRFSRASRFPRWHRKAAVLACTTLAIGGATVGALPSRADSFDHKEARFVSGAGTTLYLASSLAMPFLLHDEHATQHSLRTADAIITSSLITEVLKHIVREKRPDSSARTSFPSGHATAAFAAATMASHYHPKQALLWYAGATLIASSRVQLHRHYVHDVVAGAAIGYLTAKFEIKQPHGLLLAPFIKPDEGRRGQRMGFALNGSF